MKVYKTHKIRLLPTKEQEQLMWRHVGACRFIWNWALSEQEKVYQEAQKKMPLKVLMELLTKLKHKDETLWLNEIDSACLQTTLRNLEKAYKRFFDGQGHPKFKSRKKSKPSYPIRNNRTYFEDGEIKIPKLGKVKCQTNYSLPDKDAKLYNPRICYINNKWILTVAIESETQAIKLTDKTMGIDLGIKELCVVAFGKEQINIHNVNKTKGFIKKEKKLKRLQRKAARKYNINQSWEKTQNILKIEQQIRDIYYHLTCKRNDYIHKTTYMLISQRPRRVVMENLAVENMMKNKRLADSLRKQKLYEFRRQMQYKCEWNGIEFVLADRFYPSSKTCSNCGNIKKDLKLSDRTYKCSECGLVIDRDYNAAINLMKYAK